MIEVRNESDKPIFVKLCRSLLSGTAYLHVSDKKTKHTNQKVKANNYLLVGETEVNS